MLFRSLFVEPEEYTADYTKIAKKYIDDEGNDLKLEEVCDNHYYTQSSRHYYNPNIISSGWRCHQEPEILKVAQIQFDNYLIKIKNYKEQERLKELEKNITFYLEKDIKDQKILKK